MCGGRCARGVNDMLSEVWMAVWRYGILTDLAFEGGIELDHGRLGGVWSVVCMWIG